jgi:hypothetical protein
MAYMILPIILPLELVLEASKFLMHGFSAQAGAVASGRALGRPRAGSCGAVARWRGREGGLACGGGRCCAGGKDGWHGGLTGGGGCLFFGSGALRVRVAYASSTRVVSGTDWGRAGCPNNLVSVLAKLHRRPGSSSMSFISMSSIWDSETTRRGFITPPGCELLLKWCFVKFARMNSALRL